MKRLLNITISIFFFVSIFAGVTMKNRIEGTDNLDTELSSVDFTVGYVYDTFENSNQEFELLKELLLSSEIILKVKIKSNRKLIFQGIEYEVKVIDELRVKNDLVGDTIKLITSPFPLIYEDKTIFGSFSNFLQVDKEYVVFLDEIDPLMKPENRYLLREGALIQYLMLDNVENIPVRTSGHLYKEVSNNEFFATERGLMELETFKKEMLDLLGE